MKFSMIGGLCFASVILAQTQVDLTTQVRNPDFSAFAHTRPVQVGSTLPVSCAVGELFFSSTQSAGNALFGCSSTNTWTPLAAGALGSCTVSGNNLSCPGDVTSGTGASAGVLSLYETAVNGGNAISIAAPDLISSGYVLKLPGTRPQTGQALLFAAPDTNGVSQATWAAPGSGASGSANQLSLYGTAGNTNNFIALAAAASIPTSYTLQLPATVPQAGQTLTFAAPDTNGVAQAVWQAPSGSPLGAASLSEGTYAALPTSCAESSLYLFTDSLYSFARCTAGTWHHFVNGKAIIPPSVLSLTDMVVGSQVTLSTVHGYEQMTGVPGGTQALRSWAAPGTAPYTKYIALSVPVFLDQASYRYWSVGFADSSGKSQVLQCGVGTAIQSNFYCRVTRLSSSGVFAGQDSSPVAIPYQSGQVIVALQNDGTLLHFGISTDTSSFFEIGSAAMASFLSSPTLLTYGFLNSAPSQTLALNFLGVY